MKKITSGDLWFCELNENSMAHTVIADTGLPTRERTKTSKKQSGHCWDSKRPLPRSQVSVAKKKKKKKKSWNPIWLAPQSQTRSNCQFGKCFLFLVVFLWIFSFLFFLFHFFSFCSFFFFFPFLWLYFYFTLFILRASERAGEGQRERKRKRIPSRLHTVSTEPRRGSISWTVRAWPESKSRVGHLADSAIQVPHSVDFRMMYL